MAAVEVKLSTEVVAPVEEENGNTSEAVNGNEEETSSEPSSTLDKDEDESNKGEIGRASCRERV